MKRARFQLRTKPSRRDDHQLGHRNVWPKFLLEFEHELWRNHPVFSGADVPLVGYFDSDDLQKAIAAIATTPVDGTWQAEIQNYFEDPPSDGLALVEKVCDRKLKPASPERTSDE